MQRCRFDPVSLVSGAILVIAGVFLLVGQFPVLIQLRWAWPIVLIVIAAALLVWLVTDRVRRPLG